VRAALGSDALIALCGSVHDSLRHYERNGLLRMCEMEREFCEHEQAERRGLAASRNLIVGLCVVQPDGYCV
jgi:hypothetical protein